MKGVKKSLSLFLCFFLMIGYTTPIFAEENIGGNINDLKNNTEVSQQENVTSENEGSKEEEKADMKSEEADKNVTEEKSGEEKSVKKQKNMAK